jgi:HK97 family phage major capsid protein
MGAGRPVRLSMGASQNLAWNIAIQRKESLMGSTDNLIAEYTNELETRQAFLDSLLEQSSGRDLSTQETELVQKTSDRMTVLNSLLTPLQAAAKVSQQSRIRIEEIASDLALQRTPSAQHTVEYRSAGSYVIDRWAASVGVEDARERLNVWHRAAAHQTTADNLGIIPEPVVGPLLNFIDTSRPIVNSLGVTAMPGGRFVIPRITQHTDTAKQTAEKAELASRKMLIDRISVSMDTYGGYVNVSRQDIDWSVPQIMDIVINDLAGQYAIDTETVTAVSLKANSTAQTPVISSSSTAVEVNAAVWKAVGAAYAATPGEGRFMLLVSPDMMGAIGPLFPATNPTNANSSGFTAGSLGSGAMGSISGVQVVMSYGLAAGTVLLLNAQAARVYEQRIGALQVTEPSVLGVQVAYAGYFQVSVLVPTAVIKLTA